MRYLIVNADDLGASPGTSRGILEGHTRGIVTSTSLMVETPWSAEGAALGRAAPRLSVGLHVALPGDGGDVPDADQVRAALARQLARFEALMGRAPTHLDSHHNVHLDARVLAPFAELARRTGLPLRGHSPVRYFSKFYGQWAGESHPEHVSVASLARMLRDEIGEGITELSCHPGYADPETASAYSLEREAELRTLCDPRSRALLDALGIGLVSYHDLGRLAAVSGGE